MPNTIKNKKRLGAALSALVMGGLLLVITICMLVDYFGGGGTAAETIVILAGAGLFLAMAGGIGLALAQRWKEIEGGEEDEARKY